MISISSLKFLFFFHLALWDYSELTTFSFIFLSFFFSFHWFSTSLYLLKNTFLKFLSFPFFCLFNKDTLHLLSLNCFRSWSSNTLATSVKSQLAGKDSEAGKDWGQEEKGATEMRWLHGITDSMDMRRSKL